MAPSSPLLIVISAPSGGGKTTLCNQLLVNHPNLTLCVTCTTRPPRTGELDGIHYYFLSESKFKSKVAAGDFLEYATVYDNLYGTLRSEVLARLESGFHVLLNIDVQGAQSVRSAVLHDLSLASRLVTVFLSPPSISELERRLKKRGSESAESLARRLQQAAFEISEWTKFDYLIISSTIEEDVRRMEVILEAELLRPGRSSGPLS